MFNPVFVRSENNYDMFEASHESALAAFPDGMGESKTVQSSKDECDINTIVKRFGLTGELPSNVRVPTYGDFTEAMDFQSSMNVIVEAEAAFMRLPAEVRARFSNDPAQFVDFCADENNAGEAKRLGLIVGMTKAEAEAEAVRRDAEAKAIAEGQKPPTT